MKRPAQKVFIWAITAVLVVMSIAGCDQQSAPNKKSRIIAAENLQLKKDLQQRDKELQEQKLLLEKCLAEKGALTKRSLDDMKDLFDETFDETFNKIAEESKKLREENNNLKLQIEELKKATKGAEGQPNSEAKPSSEAK
jgi:hypothetical protein